MRVTVIADNPGVSQVQYEQVSQELGDPKKWGILVHIAGPVEGGWRVIEVWESEEALQRFFGNETVQRAFQKAGIPPIHPVISPVFRMVDVESTWEKSLQKDRS